MPIYKLTYFPARGRGEVARQLFHLADVPFEDVRIPMADWSTLKSKTPFGQIPVLEVDGKQLPQSYAIFRYLAKEFGFAGNSPFGAAWVDAIADQHRDYFAEMRPALMVYMGFAQGDKEQLVKDVATPARDKYFTLLEKIAKDNGSNGHFVGSSLTWIDLLIADHASTLTYQRLSEKSFAGDTPLEAAWVDALADQHSDYFQEISPALMVYFGFAKGDKDQLVKDVATPARDKYFNILEKIAKDNGSNGHFVGSSLTWVDLLIADHASVLTKHIPGFLDGFPTVLETVKHIDATPKLNEWIEKRPDTKF